MRRALLAAFLLWGFPRASGAMEPPSERTIRAVERGLAFLAATQQPDGSWGGKYGDTAGVVGLAALAFLARGEPPPHTEYEPVLRRCRDYLLSQQDEEGFISGGEGGRSMYSHGFAVLALTQLYGMDPDARLGPAIERGVKLIVSAQNPRGGWRYRPIPADEDDITVTGCQLMALRAARDAGFSVPENAIANGVNYLRSCQMQDGGFQYIAGQQGRSSPGRTGIGVLLLILTGNADSKEVVQGAEYMMRNPITPASHYPFYSSYYGAQAMFQIGGDKWEAWWPAMREVLLNAQTTNGSWPEVQGGPVYSTALALLALEVEWHYLPIYQR